MTFCIFHTPHAHGRETLWILILNSPPPTPCEKLRHQYFVTMRLSPVAREGRQFSRTGDQQSIENHFPPT
jgi:hypothetical protein